MTISQSLDAYLKEINTTFQAELGSSGGYVTLYNSGQRGSVKSFQVSLESLLATFKDIEKNISEFSNCKNYDEKTWRDIGSLHFSDLTLQSLVTVQTKPVFTTLSKIVSWSNSIPSSSISDNFIQIDLLSIQKTISKLEQLIHWYTPQNVTASPEIVLGSTLHLSKPFILLAGISGTGKTRFVCEQAKAHREDLSNYCLIPVRPDWHESSDLLGYVSRIGSPRYVVTELLSFIVKAWKDAAQSATADAIVIKPVNAMTPYWLCVDEMNLAPVEQYFADYLSVLESREWTADSYRCLPLLKAELFNKDDAITEQLCKDLGLDDAAYTDLWNYFKTTGIPLPPNLIVAGTVNMDETTHGFSRKVIDRAFTIDFGAFFPNDFSHYFAPTTVNKSLSFPVLSRVEPSDLINVTADPDGIKSIAFLDAINTVLKNTPFELAFRALNELLISVVCFQPKDDAELQAVWDDFLMTKVLPRIDGDGHKLDLDDEESLLTKLEAISKLQMPAIWDTQRPDLLRENVNASPLLIKCRSTQKLQWMQKRLADNSFTSFWP